MGFLKTTSGMQTQALSVGTSDVPALPTGSQLSFDLSPLPLHKAGLAYYLMGLTLTFKGSVTQSGGTGNVIPQLYLLALLIDTLSLQNAKFGTPISPNFWKGYWLQVISAVGSGYNYAVPNRGSIPASNGTYGFKFSIFIPLCMGNGSRPHHTAQLMALYRKSQFIVQFNVVNTVLAAFSPGASLGATTVQCSANLLPEREVRVGPGVEWVDYQTPASSGQTEVKLQSFGNNTGLTNTDQGAGLAFLMAMGSNGLMPGSFNPATLTQLQVPFREQIQTTHVEPFVLHQQLASMGARRMLAMGTDLGSGAGTFSDIQDFPYVAGNTPTSSANEMAGLMGLTLVPQGNDVELSKLQVVNGDVSYYLTLSSGPSGTNHTLAQHVRSWTPQMWIDSEKEIVDSGLKRAVLGDGSCRWTPKLLYGKAADEIDAKKLRFLPMCLKPITAKARRFSARP